MNCKQNRIGLLPSRRPQSTVVVNAHSRGASAGGGARLPAGQQCLFEVCIHISDSHLNPDSCSLTEQKEHKHDAKEHICLWFNKDAEVAARFYAATFPDSKLTAVHKHPPTTRAASRATS